VFNLDGSFKEILSKSPNNLGGVTAWLLAQGLYVQSTVSPNVPDCSQDGKIAQPGGNPPPLGGSANWLQCPTVFNQRATVYDIRRSWKASGPKGWAPSIYDYNT